MNNRRASPGPKQKADSRLEKENEIMNSPADVANAAIVRELDNRSHEEVTRIAASWVSANIFPGPFTQDDNSVYDNVIESLLRDTSAAGFSAEDVEKAVGDIRNFMVRSYAEANRHWREQLKGRSLPR